MLFSVGAYRRSDFQTCSRGLIGAKYQLERETESSSIAENFVSILPIRSFGNRATNRHTHNSTLATRVEASRRTVNNQVIAASSDRFFKFRYDSHLRIFF